MTEKNGNGLRITGTLIAAVALVVTLVGGVWAGAMAIAGKADRDEFQEVKTRTLILERRLDDMSDDLKAIRAAVAPTR